MLNVVSSPRIYLEMMHSSHSNRPYNVRKYDRRRCQECDDPKLDTNITGTTGNVKGAHRAKDLEIGRSTVVAIIHTPRVSQEMKGMISDDKGHVSLFDRLVVDE